jgi:fibro-slime domain-containing protein
MTRVSFFLAGSVALAPLLALACGSSSSSQGDGSGFTSSGAGSGSNGSGTGSGGTASGFTASGGASGSSGGEGGSGGTGAITATIRDFKFYDPNDNTTVPDFENPPFNIGQDGGPSPGYAGNWDDPNIVSSTLGSDNKPVYANQGGVTLTTHGASDFNKWYNDVSGTNIDIAYELPIVPFTDDAGVMEVGYDSNLQGVPYNVQGQTGDGFFPIDNQGFGNQGKPHNYSFTMEIHTVFTYKGGETFQFRGDDDVFVFINKQLVINLGGVHGPEPAQVNVDALGLTIGQVYPLDFFSAERHVTGSNIRFETTLGLRPAAVN